MDGVEKRQFFDSAELLLHLIAGVAERRGAPGTIKARGLYRDLKKHFDAEDEIAIKSDMLAIVNHLANKEYRTPEEWKRLGEIYEDFPKSVQERIKEGETVINAKKHALTIEDMEKYLDKHEIKLSYNELTREFENGGRIPDSLTTKAYSELVNEYTHVSPNIIENYCAYISREKNSYNPVLQRIKSVEYDGKDWISELCAVLRIDEKDTLSRTLVRTWCCQTIALVSNNDEKPIAGQGILILQTPQDAGKSTLVRKLAFDDPSLYTDAKLRVGDRDSVSHITSKWICELSEIGSIFRSNDPDALKQFLTSPKDTFRVPYGRHDETHARRVSFVGTLNPRGTDTRYLTDDGGDRRYWTVVCKVNFGERFDIERENAIDMVQLWRQAYEMVQTDGEKAYRLTKDETNALIFRNREYMKPVPGEAELRDIIEQSYVKDKNGKSKYRSALVTASEIKKLYSDELKPFSAEKIGTALVKLGYESDRRRRYQFPIPIYSHLSTEAALSEAQNA